MHFTFRNMNQDGLENLFGCIMSCCQIACSPISTQFRSGYTTTLLNNLTSPNSIYTNCENDASIPLIQNVHELISEYENADPSDNRVDSDIHGMVGLTRENIIDIDPLFTVPDSDVSEGKAYECSRICRKLVQKFDCQACLSTVLIIQEDDSFSLKNPSDSFIETFQTLMYVINDIVPRLCAEKFLKKKILTQIETLDIKEVGCLEHAKVVMLTLKELCVNFGIVLFCQNINSILSGKITSIPAHSNNIQVLALDFKKSRKNIGKHSDILQK